MQGVDTQAGLTAAALRKLRSPHAMAPMIMTMGFIGACLRYLLEALFPTGMGFPFATLFINIFGCFTLELINQYVGRRMHLPPVLVTSLGVGLVGAFTTLSAFSTESLTFLQDGRYGMFAVYMLLTVVTTFLASLAGHYASRGLMIRRRKKYERLRREHHEEMILEHPDFYEHHQALLAERLNTLDHLHDQYEHTYEHAAKRAERQRRFAQDSNIDTLENLARHRLDTLDKLRAVYEAEASADADKDTDAGAGADAGTDAPHHADNAADATNDFRSANASRDEDASRGADASPDADSGTDPDTTSNHQAGGR